MRGQSCPRIAAELPGSSVDADKKQVLRFAGKLKIKAEKLKEAFSAPCPRSFILTSLLLSGDGVLGVDCEDIGLHEAGAAEGRSVEVE